MPVQIPSPEVYDALSRGTIDGVLYSYVGAKSDKLNDLLKHAVGNLSVGSTGVSYSISDQAWDKLPDNVKSAMAEAGAEAQQNICSTYDTETAEIRATFAQGGMEITDLSEADLAEAHKLLGGIEDKWLKKMDDLHKDGASTLAAFKAAPGQ